MSAMSDLPYLGGMSMIASDKCLVGIPFEAMEVPDQKGQKWIASGSSRRTFFREDSTRRDGQFQRLWSPQDGRESRVVVPLKGLCLDAAHQFSYSGAVLQF